MSGVNLNGAQLNDAQLNRVQSFVSNCNVSICNVSNCTVSKCTVPSFSICLGLVPILVRTSTASATDDPLSMRYYASGPLRRLRLRPGVVGGVIRHYQCLQHPAVAVNKGGATTPQPSYLAAIIRDYFRDRVMQ